MTQPLTEDEKKTLRDAAYGAIFLVSCADPGLVELVKESVAAARELAGSSGVVREVLTTGDIPVLRDSSPQVEAGVLAGLRRSMAILREKAPEEAVRFRATVLAAGERAAAAGGGVGRAEAAALDKIKAALGTS